MGRAMLVWAGLVRVDARYCCVDAELQGVRAVRLFSRLLPAIITL